MSDRSPAARGLDAAVRALAAGHAVAVPNPSPMTYGIVATDPRAVNAVKGRPTDQNVAVSVHAAAQRSQVAALLDLDDGSRSLVANLLRRRLSLLVPLRAAAPLPAWLAPAVRNGYLAIFDGHWRPAAALWDRFPRLFGSSANRTGRLPAACAADVVGMFGTDLPVVDADDLRDLNVAHAASTMVRVAPDGTLTLHRTGSHDAGRDPQAFLRELMAS